MMKTNTKARVLSFVLSLLMIISIVPAMAVTAFAATTTHKVTVTGGLPYEQNAEEGKTVNISVDVTKIENGYAFEKWTVVSGGVTLNNANSANTYFTMGNSDVEIKAEYKVIPVSDYTLTVTGGQVKVDNADVNASSNVAPGKNVSITAVVPSGYTFKGWTVKKGTVTLANTETVTFTMPSENVAIEAVFESKPVTKYNVTVNGGVSVPATAATGETVTIKANSYANKVFYRWVVTAGNVALANYYSNETTFVMGNKDVAITAEFKDPTPMTISVVNAGYVKLTNSNGVSIWGAKKGETVNVSLDEAKVPTGMTFTGWRVLEGNGTFASETAKNTTFTMGEGTAKIMPCFDFTISVSLAYYYGYNFGYNYGFMNGTLNAPYYTNYYNVKTISVNSTETVASVAAKAKKELGVNFDLSLYLGSTLLDEKAMIGSYGVTKSTYLNASQKVITPSTPSNPTTPSNPSITTPVVYFDANGGYVSTTWANTYGGYLLNIPTATRPGYVFDGWYTSRIGGAKVTAYSQFAASTVLYAHWTSSSTYTIRYAIQADANGNAMGTIKNYVTSAVMGDKVSFTVKANSGYELNDIVVKDTNGKIIALAKGTLDSYSFTMPYGDVSITITFNYLNPYTDVSKTDKAYDAIIWATENGIANGTSANKFSPDGLCTRGYMVAYLWRAAGSPTPKTKVNPFNDVNKGDYYYNAVLWANEEGIVKGTSETTFSPNKTVNRAQALTFIWRFAGESTKFSSNFSDVATNSYYYNAVSWATKNNIAKGIGNNKFDPMGDCTRADVVSFLYSYFVD